MFKILLRKFNAITSSNIFYSENIYRYYSTMFSRGFYTNSFTNCSSSYSKIFSKDAYRNCVTNLFFSRDRLWFFNRHSKCARKFSKYCPNFFEKTHKWFFLEYLTRIPQKVSIPMITVIFPAIVIETHEFFHVLYQNLPNSLSKDYSSNMYLDFFKYFIHELLPLISIILSVLF